MQRSNLGSRQGSPGSLETLEKAVPSVCVKFRWIGLSCWASGSSRPPTSPNLRTQIFNIHFNEAHFRSLWVGKVGSLYSTALLHLLPCVWGNGLSSPGAASALRPPLVLALDELDAILASSAFIQAARRRWLAAAVPVLTRLCAFPGGCYAFGFRFVLQRQLTPGSRCSGQALTVRLLPVIEV